jgi:hypothetical protein
MAHFLPDIFPPEISLRESQHGCETSPRIIRQLGGKRVPEIQCRQASATEEQSQVFGEPVEVMARQIGAANSLSIKVELEQAGWTKATELG